MAKTINFAQQVRHKPDREKLVRLISRTTVILVIVYLVILGAVFGISFYLQAKLKKLQAEAGDLATRVEEYVGVESRLVAVKKRVKLVTELKKKDGEGLGSGIERALDLVNSRSVINKLSVSSNGRRAELSLTETELNDLLAVFEDSTNEEEAEGGYTNVRMVSLKKNEDGQYEFSFIFELES